MNTDASILVAGDDSVPDGETLVAVDRVTRRFGRFEAVADVAFSLRAGEVVGLLGPNGAGKSTLLRVLAGFLPPSRGTVRIAGWDIVENSLAARQCLGYLPEQVALYRDMQVYEYLKFRARLKGLRGRDCRRRVTDVLALCDLETVASQGVRSLSQGYRQRVGLADALVNHPPVLLLDEPGMGMDPYQQGHLRRILAERGKHCAILFSSHGLSEVERICGRVMIMRAGRIVAQDTPARLVDRWRGRVRFLVEARGEVGRLLQTCRDHARVVTATIEPGDDWSRLRIEADKDSDLGAELFEMAVRSGCVLRECRRERDGLDDVFTAMTGPVREDAV